MEEYEDFRRQQFRRRYRTPQQLLEYPIIATSSRKEPIFPKKKPGIDVVSAPEKRIYRHLTLDDRKRVLLLRYGSLTDFSGTISS
jgi:hypothetical protein